MVRGGYGIFFAHPFDAGVPNAVALGFSVSRELNSPDNGITAPFYLRDGVPPAASTARNWTTRFGAVPLGTNANTAVTFFEQNRRTGYSQQFNLGVQRQLGGSSVVELTLLGNLSRKLASTPCPSIRSRLAARSAASVTARSSFPAVQQCHDSVANDRACQLLWRNGALPEAILEGTCPGRELYWSRFFDNTNEVGGTIGDNGGPYSNYYDRSRDYGPSANDIRHRFVAHFVYELPFGTGRRWLFEGPLRYIVGGWSISDVTTVQSGAPSLSRRKPTLRTRFQRARFGPMSCATRISIPVSGAWRDGSTRRVRPAGPYQFGNQGVGSARGPGVVNFDVSLLAGLSDHGASSLRTARGVFQRAEPHEFQPAGACVRRTWFRSDQRRRPGASGSGRQPHDVLT